MIIKNDKVTSEIIKKVREYVLNDNKEVKKYLGINSTNIVEAFPIRNREFSIWILLDEDEEIIGVITFDKEDEKEVFLKMLYIVPKYRGKNYGYFLLSKFMKKYPKIKGRINEGNNRMYKLARRVGLKGEKRKFDLDASKEPVWWSNALDDRDYSV